MPAQNLSFDIFNRQEPLEPTLCFPFTVYSCSFCHDSLIEIFR